MAIDGRHEGESESEIMAAEDQALQTKYYKQKQIANADCKQFNETVQHIMSACTILATDQYIKRRDRVCAEWHCNKTKEIEAKLHNEHWYYRVPKSGETSNEGKVTNYGTNKYEPTELILTTNRTT